MKARTSSRNAASSGDSVSCMAASPLLAEGTDLEFERPGSLRLLVKLPVGLRDRGWRDQQIRIVESLLSPELLPAFPHPGRIDTGIDDEMRDMDVLGAQLTRHRLCDCTQAELGAGESGEDGGAAQAGCRAGGKDVA